jgi:glycine C-acetyltransferase
MQHEVITEHLENFSLADFYKMGWETVDTKTSFFSSYFRGMLRDGFIMREAEGPAAARMRVAGREVLMFGSNNYLGFANEPEIVEKTIAAIREFGIGCGGPPLLNGYTSLHRELERRLAALKGCEDAVLFSSGYSANVGWTTGLLSPGDWLVFDAQNHASLFDGMKMGRFEGVPFAHNDAGDLRRRLMQVRWKHPYTNIAVCVEGVYSMDGDVAPLPEIRRICSKYGALLAVDDAHGTGVLGERGRGTAEHFGLEGQVDLAMGTFSKTFAVTGGFVAGDRELADYLRFFSRSYMFSASLPPPVVASVLAGLDFLEAHPERVRQLRENVAYFVGALKRLGFDVASESAIIPIPVPEGVPIRKLVARLFEEGVFVNGVEYPAVPRDKQRLRTSMMATFTREDLDRAVGTIARVGKEFGLPC